jgi:hypothetical protein
LKNGAGLTPGKDGGDGPPALAVAVDKGNMGLNREGIQVNRGSEFLILYIWTNRFSFSK